MNLKKAMYDRIEQHSVKMNIKGEDVFLKKSMGGWHVIYPPVSIKSIEQNTDSNGNINWKRVKWDKTALIFGSKQNAIMTAVVGVITLLVIYGVWQVIASYNSIINNVAVQGCLKSLGLALR